MKSEREVNVFEVDSPLLACLQWCAYFGNDPDKAPHGYGSTRAEAIKDLKENL